MGLLLGVNVDHVATLRQARYRGCIESPNAEPDPVEAAKMALAAGADSITIHVRGDRRHLQPEDAVRMRGELTAPLNLELGNTSEMLALALQVNPEFACLVPETREEVTTEGGLDAALLCSELAPTIKSLQHAGIKVSLFIDPELVQIEAAAALGVEMVELHTGGFANAFGKERQREIDRLVRVAEAGHRAGLQVNAGHGINYENIKDLLVVPHLTEFNIGHSIVARSVMVGLAEAVKEMKGLMSAYPNRS